MGKFKQINLSKGGKLYYVKNKISKSTMVRISFDCGSRCDTIPGLAHFVEHMFFCGTKTMTRDEINKKYFDFIGANAGTSAGNICFDGNIFTKEFEEYVKTVAMMITESTFKQKEVEKECGIIQQEISRKKDKFNMLASNKNRFNLTGLKCYEDYGALGTEDSVAKIKSKDIKAFVKKYFIANNLQVFVASPLSEKKVKKIIENNLVAKLSFDEKFEHLPYYVNYVKNSTFKQLETKDIGKNYIFINFKHKYNVFDFDFRAKASITLDMVNEFSNGIMKLLREQKSLVYSGGFGATIKNDKESVTTFYTECARKNVNAVIETVAEYFDNVVKNGFTESQLKQAKRMIKYNNETKEPRVGGLLNKLNDFDVYGRILKNEIRSRMKKVTLDECNELFKELFYNKDISLTIYGNITKEELMTDERFDDLFIKD